MEVTSLKNDYIKVISNGGATVYHGGNQELFESSPWCNIKGQGCGMISAIDVLLYINGTDRIALADYKEFTHDFLHTIVFTKLFLHEFFSGKFVIGIVPRQIKRYLKKKTNGNYLIKWNGRAGHEGLLTKMKAQIYHDIPVPWALYRKGKRINLYTYNDKTNTYSFATTTNSHYVNAISVIEDESQSEHKTMIKISSWGKLFYIDYNEYLDYVGNSIISKYCSNIMLIRKASKN